MGVKIVLPYYLGGSSSSSSSDFPNAATLRKLSTDLDGNLVFNGKVIGEKSIEVSYNINLEDGQSSIELPNDCDISRTIVVFLNGIPLQQGEFWKVIEKTSPEKDTIVLKGLDFQANDNISITYYRKV